jgi:hypothetical protein|tara:strand:- start:7271 stop:9577 length:2307 start_codon:yes stop_codon:yes gene_type:complete
MAEEESDKLTFDQQCFLMDYSDILSRINREGACKYKNYHCLEVGADEGPYDAIAVLTGRDNLTGFVEMTPHQQSLLQPRVRLFKVTPGVGDTEDTEEEFMFRDFTDPDAIAAITADATGRGGGIGLKEFGWEFAGTNPAEAERVINVNMKLYFQTVNDLKGNWETKSAGDGSTPSFLELILIPPGTGQVDKNGTEYYKVKAVVGWAMPEGDIIEDSLKRQIATMQMVMYLNIITHEIAINEDGSLEVDCEYVASLEEALNSPAADVLYPLDLGKGEIDDIDEELAEIEEALAEAEFAAECAQNDGAESEYALAEREIQDLKERQADLQADREEVSDESATDAYSKFTDRMKDRLRFLDLPNGFINDWEENEGGTRPALDGAEITMPEEGWFSDPSAAAGAQDPKDPDLDRIYYVYLGDLIEVACLSFHPMAPTIMQMFSDRPYTLKNMKIVLGPMMFTDARTGLDRQMNLADCPVSYTMFLQFWNEQVIEKEKKSYPVKQFMKDLVQQLIRPAMKPGCFPKAEPQSADVSMVSITIPHPEGIDILDNGKRRASLTDVRDAMPSTFNAEDPCWNYIMYYMASYSARALQGDPTDDARKGVYHYEIGRDAGLVKKIDFSKSDVKGLKEARQSQDGGLSQLREIYNAKVDMVGNNLYIPGMKVFLNPPYGLGDPTDSNSAANLLGLGGYFDVIKVQSSIKRGGAYTTKLETIFSHSGAPPEDNADECAEALDQIKEASPWTTWWDEIADEIGGWFESPPLDASEASPEGCD